MINIKIFTIIKRHFYLLEQMQILKLFFLKLYSLNVCRFLNLECLVSSISQCSQNACEKNQIFVSGLFHRNEFKTQQNYYIFGEFSKMQKHEKFCLYPMEANRYMMVVKNMFYLFEHNFSIKSKKLCDFLDADT